MCWKTKPVGQQRDHQGCNWREQITKLPRSQTIVDDKEPWNETKFYSCRSHAPKQLRSEWSLCSRCLVNKGAIKQILSAERPANKFRCQWRGRQCCNHQLRQRSSLGCKHCRSMKRLPTPQLLLADKETPLSPGLTEKKEATEAAKATTHISKQRGRVSVSPPPPILRHKYQQNWLYEWQWKKQYNIN